MSRDDEKAILAGEYVLGVLLPEERAWVERARLSDPELDAAIGAWQAQLQAVDDTVQPVEPEPDLWSRIETSLFPAPRPRTDAAPRGLFARLDDALWSSLPFWRLGGLAAASIAALVATGSWLVPPPVPLAVTVLATTSESKEPGWLVEAFDDGSIRLLPLLRSEVPPDRALELWTQRDEAEGLVSLGLLQQAASRRVPRSGLAPSADGQLVGISLEPGTGSPTGRPTGPILFIGKAKRTPRLDPG